MIIICEKESDLYMLLINMLINLLMISFLCKLIKLNLAKLKSLEVIEVHSSKILQMRCFIIFKETKVENEMKISFGNE